MAKVRLTKPLIVLFAVVLAMPVCPSVAGQPGFFMTGYAAEKASPPKEPVKISAPASTEIGELSLEIKQLVKGLEYSDKVAEDFVTMVSGWKDAEGRPVLISWDQRLNQAKDEYRQGKISKDQFAKVEESIAKELSQGIQKEIGPDYSGKFFDLADVIKHRQAQCFSYSQLFYVLGNSVGLSVKAIDVYELVIPGPLPAGDHHIACLVSLADGETMMVDLAQVTRGLVSKPFIIGKEFTKVGNFWQLKDKANPLRIHRRIEILDKNGLIAGIYFNRGLAYGRLGQHIRAISDFNKAIQLNPKYAYAYNNRGAAYGKLRRYTRAISDFNKAIQLNPKLALAYNNRGVTYGNLGQHTRAISDFNKAIELNPKDAEAYSNRGDAYRKLGQYTEAIPNYNKAIELNPKYAGAYNNRGVTYGHLGQYTRAISDFNKVIELNPKHTKAHTNRGRAYAFLGKSEEAKKDLLKAVELNPALKADVKKVSDQFKLGLKLDNS